MKITEAVALRCSVKKVFLEILQNLQESTCTRDSFSGTLFKKNLWHRYPANICWSWRRLEDIFNTSSTHLQHNNFTSSKMSWRRLEDILQDVLKTSWKMKICYAEGVLKTSWRHVLNTSWRHVLKMSWRHVWKTSWRHYGDKQNTYWGYLYLTNLNVYLTNLYLTNLDNYKTNPKCIK